jgi:hypothetical protein
MHGIDGLAVQPACEGLLQESGMGFVQLDQTGNRL